MTTIEELFLSYRERGDVAALGRVFDRTSPTLFRLALTLSHDAASAEDALQETFLAAIRSADRWDASRPLAPWLTGILRHKVSESRRRAARGPTGDPPDIARAEDPGEIAAREELTEAARRALEDLPEPYRMAALLRWQHGLEPAEIANLTGQRPGTVRVTLHRAMKRLQRRLGATLALLPGVGAERATRGLSTIRSEVLDEAAVLSGRTTASVIGAMAAGALIVLLGTAGLVGALGSDAGDDALDGSGTVEVASNDGRPGDRERVAAHAPRPADGAADALPEQPGAPDAPTGPTLDGTVTLEGGAPAAGAIVYAIPQDLERVRQLRDLQFVDEDVSSAEVGADGSVAVPTGGSGAVLFDLLVVAPGHAIAHRESVPIGARFDVQLRYAPVGRGVLVDSEGSPIVGASVAARAMLPIGVRVGPAGAVTTDDAGVFHVPPALRGRAVTLDIDADGFAPVALDVGAAALASDPPPRILVLRGTPLRGRVVRADNGVPVAGATVEVGGRARSTITRRGRTIRAEGLRMAPLVSTTTDASGRFSFDAIPTEPLARSTLIVRAGTERLHAPLVRVSGQKSPGEIVVELEARPLCTVRGRVVDELADPVRHATIDGTGFGDRLVSTDEDGRFEIEVTGSHDAAFEARLVVRPPHGPETGGVTYPRAERRVTVRAVENRAVDVPEVVLPAPVPSMLARVTVVDADGAPVAGATVRSTGARAPWFTTDADGRCDVVWHTDPVLLGHQVRGEDRTLVAEAPGHGRCALRIRPVAGTPEDVRLQLARADRIAGRVLDARGEPLRGAYVYAVGELAGEESWFTSAVADDGSFSLDDLPIGDYAIRVQWPPALEIHRDMHEHGARVVTGADLELRLPPDPAGPSGSVIVRATDARTGRPVVSFGVALTSADEQYHAEIRSTRIAVGVARRAAVPARRLRMIAQAHGFVAESRWIDVPADGLLEIDVAFERGVQLTGTVRFPDGSPADGQYLRLEPLEQTHVDLNGPPLPGGIWINADARYGLDSVPAGRYRATTHGSGPSGTLTASGPGVCFEVEEGRDTQTLDIVVVRAGRLEITTDLPGLPSAERVMQEGVAPGALPVGRLLIRDQTGAVVLDRSGLWRDMGASLVVAAGTYEVTVSAPGLPERTETVEVEPGGRAQLPLPPPK